MLRALIVLGLLLTANFASASANDLAKAQTAQELAFIRAVFQTGYAPADWKKQHLNWDIDTAYNAAVAQLNATPSLTGAIYRDIVSSVFKSTNDYHVGFSFFTSEMAQLPFSVFGADGRYFIVYINEAKLNKDTFPFQVGDEVVQFDGKPTADVVNDLRSHLSGAAATTDQRLAERLLTARAAAMAMSVPSGQVEVQVKRPRPGQSDLLITRQLTWDYTPEAFPWNPAAPNLHLTDYHAQSSTSKYLNMQMAWAMQQPWKASVDIDTASPFQLGGRKSWVPILGQQITKSAADDQFDSYLYRNEQGKLIGYVRIPAYDGKKGDSFKEFKKIIAQFQSLTDALVIDEVNNPGGSLFYVYALTSLLSPDPIRVPRHAITIWPEMVSDSVEQLQKLSSITNDEDAQKALGQDQLDGFPVTYTAGRAMLDFERSVIAEWKAGKHLTAPLYFQGVDKVNPDPQVNYTKPILILTNELDFSGGDFFPAIMQDNKRAKIFGARTSGAGGYILQVSYPSPLGLNKFSFTGSIAQRVDGHPIENLGVTPDIPCQVTVHDLTSGFQDYRDAVNAAVTSLLP